MGIGNGARGAIPGAVFSPLNVELGNGRGGMVLAAAIDEDADKDKFDSLVVGEFNGETSWMILVSNFTVSEGLC